MDIKKVIGKISDKVSDKVFNENEFNKLAIELVRFNSIYDKVNAIHNKENSELRFYKEPNLKRNDKLIDKHDNVYFVEEVIINQPYKLNLNNIIIKEKEKTVKTLIVKYSKKQIEIPETIRQSVKIETNVNITAQNSNFNGGLANYNISQNANYNQIFTFMKLLANNTFHVKELQPFILELETKINKKENIEQKWYDKFFKFMGTQLLEVAKQFISSYIAFLAVK